MARAEARIGTPGAGAPHAEDLPGGVTLQAARADHVGQGIFLLSLRSRRCSGGWRGGHAFHRDVVAVPGRGAAGVLPAVGGADVGVPVVNRTAASEYDVWRRW